MSKPVPVAPANGAVGFLRGGRVTPLHGFTPASICRKRFLENTSSLAVTINFILPTLQSVNKALEKHIDEGSDVPTDELVGIFVNCTKSSAKTYADRLARVACQTCFASILIKVDTPTANSMVYLWDLYPRLMQRYVGELLDLLRIPRFLSVLLGPSPSSEDVAFLQSRATAVDAFTSSLQRNCIFAVADIVVDTVRIAASPKIESKEKPVVVAKTVVARCTTCVCWAVGAAVGRGVAGERGEYWGEYLGTVMAPTVVVQVLSLAVNVKKTRKKSSGSGRHRSASSHSARGGSDKTAMPSAASTA